MPAVNDERLLRVRCDARLLFVIFAVFPALVISGSLKMLKTIRVTFQKPRLSPRPIFLSAAEDFLAVVEVRKTYVDFEVVNNSDDSGLPPQLLMPIRVDNDPQTILLWLSEDVNYRQVNVDLVKAACRTRLHLSDGECQRLLTSADIFVNRALNHTSQTSSIKICLRVNREYVHHLNDVDFTRVHEEGLHLVQAGDCFILQEFLLVDEADLSPALESRTGRRCSFYNGEFIESMLRASFLQESPLVINLREFV